MSACSSILRAWPRRGPRINNFMQASTRPAVPVGMAWPKLSRPLAAVT